MFMMVVRRGGVYKHETCSTRHVRHAGHITDSMGFQGKGISHVKIHIRTAIAHGRMNRSASVNA
jgi:hypothetical protein